MPQNTRTMVLNPSCSYCSGGNQSTTGIDCWIFLMIIYTNFLLFYAPTIPPPIPNPHTTPKRKRPTRILQWQIILMHQKTICWKSYSNMLYLPLVKILWNIYQKAIPIENIKELKQYVEKAMPCKWISFLGFICNSYHIMVMTITKVK